ncbi:MAG: N-acetylmuramoyl-L-alanine amidase [Wenzhouxiangella sp.]|nr:N-acetylmuramoyl-L-alanine amidase [Wenzhouxiangella sp.]TVR95995.1 MAG: AMIN domain-containing protein [Wenzhouxiangellaceae bacterium]
MRIFGLALVLLTWSLTSLAGEVRNLRIWAGPDSTRAVLDLDGRVEYRLFTLENPARVVVDIDAASIREQLPFNPERGGVIAGVRHGIRNGVDLRVVFDLQDEVKPQSFLLDPAGEYGHRLVIDLIPENAQSPTERVREVARAARNGEREMIVAIDPGHGGEDPGAVGPGGTFEKEVTLAISRELERRINAMPGMRAVLIRTGDYFVPLQERYTRARHAQADLFLSIHADAFRDFRVRGSSVYVLSRSGASSEAARLLAQRENQSDLVGGVKLDRGDDMLSSVLLDLSQSAALEYSNNAAEKILGQLGAVGRRHRTQVERANFVVLRSPDVPSVLIEVGFISNPQDEQNLNNAQHRRKVADAIASGVHDHFMRTAPQGTWFAANRSRDRHVVERGDTLGLIAQRYQVSVNRLREANNLNGDVIHPGAVLVIPTGS